MNVPGRNRSRVPSAQGRPTGRTVRRRFESNRIQAAAPRVTIQMPPKGQPALRKGKGLKKQVQNLVRKVKAGEATRTVRTIIADRQLANAQNAATIADYNAFTTTTLETSLANLRYYDPAAPATLVTADGNTGSYSRQFYFDKLNSTIEVANNYKVNCELRVYYVTPREDTSITSVNAVAQGLADQGNPSTTGLCMFPTDSEQFRKLWHIQMSKHKELKPGQSIKMNFSPKDFNYDPSNVDSHSLLYQNRYQSGAWMIRLQGALSHDNAADQQGFDNAGVDISVRTTLRITYDAGVSLEDYEYIQTGVAAMTTAAVTSQQTVSQQSYSATT